MRALKKTKLEDPFKIDEIQNEEEEESPKSSTRSEPLLCDGSNESGSALSRNRAM